MPKVLIVEDSEETLELLKMASELEGYEVGCAGNGMEGLKKAKDFQPDIILLDIMMPDMDGYAMNKKLKADPDLKDIPVCVLTAKAGLSTMFDALTNTQVDAYFSKPFQLAQVLKKMAELVQKRTGVEKGHG